jgi:ammonium transporter, Amt family
MTLVYCPIAHWIWHPNGWLFKLGILDFAGGLVVHLSSGLFYKIIKKGTAALVFSILLRRREGYKNLLDYIKGCCNKKQKKAKKEFEPHNIPMVILGTGKPHKLIKAILWFGWFGFNGGSSLFANAQGAVAFVNTTLAGSAAGFTWNLIDYLIRGKISAVGFCVGAVAGLAAITPLAGYTYPSYAILVGFVTAITCPFFIKFKAIFFDDSLDVVGVHFFTGLLGPFVTGIFASSDVVRIAANVTIGGGWISQNYIQLAIQLVKK